MGPFLPRYRRDVHQAEVCFVNQSCGLERGSGVLSSPVPPGHTLQLAVHKGDQSV